MHHLILFSLLSLNISSSPNATISLDKLEGSWELAYTHLNGEIQTVEKNYCGYAEILEIDSTRWNKSYSAFGHDVLLRGATGKWICGVNPESYQINMEYVSCGTFLYQDQQDPDIWLFYGGFGSYKMHLEVLEDHLFFSFVEELEGFDDPHHLFKNKETIVYRRISNQAFEPGT